MEAADAISAGLDALAEANLWSLPHVEVGRLLVTLERLSRRLAHAQMVALGQANGIGLAARDGTTSLPAWLRAAADVPHATSKARLALSAALHHRPVTE